MELWCYEPVWSMVPKLRKEMGNWDACCPLEDIIEFEEGYFTIEFFKIEKEKRTRRHCDADKQHTEIMTQSVPLENIKTGKTYKP